ncbi:hypothetical protein NL676_028003 [Syzygium grande]|nr:hypothetical protein NL676_028003 [Syzygium grande]
MDWRRRWTYESRRDLTDGSSRCDSAWEGLTMRGPQDLWLARERRGLRTQRCWSSLNGSVAGTGLVGGSRWIMMEVASQRVGILKLAAVVWLGDAGLKRLRHSGKSLCSLYGRRSKCGG